MIAFFLRTTDLLIPPDFRVGDAGALLRARLIVAFSLVLACVAAAFVPFMAYRGLGTMCVALGVAAVADLSPIAVLWRTRDVELAGRLPGLLATTGLAGIAALQGGLYGDAPYWSPVIIVTAMLISGRRGALVAVIAQVVALAALAALGALQLLPTPAEEWPPLLKAYELVVMGGAVFGLTSLFESANQRMRTALEVRNTETRHVLDNVGQGFLCAVRGGEVVGDRSAAAERWFGPPRGVPVWAWLGSEDPHFASALEVGWIQLWDDILPIELCLDQLPARVHRDGRTYGVEYHPVQFDGVGLGRVVVVLTDITERLQIERSEAEQKELVGVLDRILRDRNGFYQFVGEVDAMFGRMMSSRGDTRRLLHTLKGNCSMFGVHSVAEQCHELEGRLAEDGREPHPDEIQALYRAWEALRNRVSLVRGDRANVFEMDSSRYEALREATRRHLPYDQLDCLVTALMYEPALVPLNRLVEHAQTLAARLGRPEPRVHVHDGGLLLDPNLWEPFWAGFVHVVRNAVDHGTRTGEGGVLHISAERVGASVCVELTDRGPGIAWGRVAERAASLGLPHATEADIVEALFVDGLSTVADATDVSGRGVGLGAFRAAVRAMGGEVEVVSRPGAGTRVRAVLPGAVAQDAAPALRDSA